jgi:WD40 repeat protein
MNDLCADNSSVLCINSFHPDGTVPQVGFYHNQHCVAFSPSSLCVATGHTDGSVKLLHAQADGLFVTQQLTAGVTAISVIPQHPHRVQCISFSPCGVFLACVFKPVRSKVDIFNVSTGALLYSLQSSEHERIYPCIQSINAVACTSHNGCLLLALGKSGSQAVVPAKDCSSVQLWRLQHATPATCIQVLRPKDTDVLALSFSPASSAILALVSSGSACVDMWISPKLSFKFSSSSGASEVTSTSFRGIIWDDDQAERKPEHDAANAAELDRPWCKRVKGPKPGSKRLPHFPAAFGLLEGGLVVAQRCNNGPEDALKDDPRMSRDGLRACARFQHSRLYRASGDIHKIGVIPNDIIHEFTSVAISPSGLQVATCGGGGIGLWDMTTGDLFREFGSGQEMAIAYLVCSGAVVLASVDRSNVLKLWV